MRAHEIENWALNVIDCVESGKRVEDFRVELKAEWPQDVKKAARRIAGHANAARGQSLLWLIGVDENKGVVGVDQAEMANWYEGVKQEFDGLAPRLLDFNIPVKGTSVVALFFETDRAPFVVKNPQHGLARGGPVALEVPWRENTFTRSATRSDLLRLLNPLQQLPEIEVVGAILQCTQRQGQPSDGLFWECFLRLYASQLAGQMTVIPSHRCDITITIGGDLLLAPSKGLRFEKSGSHIIATKINEVLISGPGMFETNYHFVERELNRLEEPFGDNAEVMVTLRPASAEHGIPVTAHLLRRGEPEETTRLLPGNVRRICRWDYGDTDF